MASARTCRRARAFLEPSQRGPRDGRAASSMFHVRRWLEDKRTALRLLAVLTVLVLAGLGLFTVFRGGNDQGPSQAVLQGQAKDSCHEWVREQAAHRRVLTRSGYGAGDALVTTFVDVRVGGSGPWSIAGQADAVSDRGGKLRMGWACEVRREGTLMKGEARLLR